MKVFISWSGQQSHRVATVLRDWLPSVIQTIIPYVSSEDIDKGARWTTDIAAELNQSTYGILCVTQENVAAPWLNFEAGALGKSVDKSRVSPFLFRVKRSEVEGPILQFQSTIFEKDDVFKLIKSLNASCDASAISDARLEKAFEVWWPTLKKDLDSVPDVAPLQEPDKKPQASGISGISKILEEVLDLSRTNQKLLRSPEELLPPPYLERVFSRRMREFPVDHPAWDDLFDRFARLRSYVKALPDEIRTQPGMAELLEHIENLRRPLSYFARQERTRGPSRRLFDPDIF